MNIVGPQGGSIAYSKNIVTARKALSKPEVEAVIIDLAPGSSLPVHTTPGLFITARREKFDGSLGLKLPLG